MLQWFIASTSKMQGACGRTLAGSQGVKVNTPPCSGSQGQYVTMLRQSISIRIHAGQSRSIRHHAQAVKLNTYSCRAVKVNTSPCSAVKVNASSCAAIQVNVSSCSAGRVNTSAFWAVELNKSTCWTVEVNESSCSTHNCHGKYITMLSGQGQLAVMLSAQHSALSGQGQYVSKVANCAPACGWDASGIIWKPSWPFFSAIIKNKWIDFEIIAWHLN